MNKLLSKKYLSIFGLILMCFVGIIISTTFLKVKNLETDQEVRGEMVSEEIKVAVCPTMYTLFNNLEGIVLVRADSTSDSVSKLNSGDVQYVLSGRVPKPEENIYDFVILKEGMSFLSTDERVISLEDIFQTKIYTDLDLKDSQFKNIEKVDNVYDYLNQGIVITSWDNTDYSRANIAHVLNENGSRWIDSRAPILYCKNTCDSNLIEVLSK